MLDAEVVDLLDFENRVDEFVVGDLADAFEGADDVDVADVVLDRVSEEIGQRFEVVDVWTEEDHVLEFVPGNFHHIVRESYFEL